MEKRIIINNLFSIDKAAEEFVNYISNAATQSNIIAFEAPMGAGKTTFIKALCSYLGVKDVVNSPTFTIVNEYKSAKGFPIYHFDFYRINKLSEAMDIGVQEYFASDGLCLIEWPEKIADLLPDDVISVYIVVNDDESRELVIK